MRRIALALSCAAFARKYHGRPCKCHRQRMGHTFNPELRCYGCGTTWKQHQRRPWKCEGSEQAVLG